MQLQLGLAGDVHRALGPAGEAGGTAQHGVAQVHAVGPQLEQARAQAGGALAKAAPYTVKVEHGGATLYRARFSGFSEQDTAQDACKALKRSGFNCFATRS